MLKRVFELKKANIGFFLSRYVFCMKMNIDITSHSCDWNLFFCTTNLLQNRHIKKSITNAQKQKFLKKTNNCQLKMVLNFSRLRNLVQTLHSVWAKFRFEHSANSFFMFLEFSKNFWCQKVTRTNLVLAYTLTHQNQSSTCCITNLNVAHKNLQIYVFS